MLQADIPDLAVTLDEFLSRTDFAAVMTELLHTLEAQYHTPVDLGFTAQMLDPDDEHPETFLTLLHCRRQDYLAGEKPAPLPLNLPAEKVLFSTRFMVPRGQVTGIRHVLFVTPEGYATPAGPARPRRAAPGHLPAQHACWARSSSFCLGPGQWGADNPRLGVYISYADIYNAAALVELYGKGPLSPDGGAGIVRPDPALGTYAFQDLMEARIYPLTVNLDPAVSGLNHAFLYESRNLVENFLKLPPALAGCLRLVDVADYAPGCHLALNMDDEGGLAVAFFAPG